MRVAVMFAAAMVVTAPMARADCAPVRAATAEEQKIYADAFALFQRVAPAAPQGWEIHDGQKDGVLKEVCAGPRERVTRWGFNRSYERKEGMEARQAEAQKQANALVQDSQARMKANEAKLADLQKRMQANMMKAQELMKAGKIAEIEALNQQTEALIQEQAKLMNVDGQDAAMKAMDAEARRDTSASFSLTVGVTDLDTRAYSPVTVAGIKAFRQLVEASGSSPATADFIVVLNPAAAAKGPQTVVRTSGDPARAEELLKAAKLR